MPDLVSLLAQFLDALGLETVHLAGFSMGGAVALGLALGAPERIRTLTLTGSYGLDSRAPLPLLPYLAMRAPRFTTAVSWSMRRSRRLVRLDLSRSVCTVPPTLAAERGGTG